MSEQLVAALLKSVFQVTKCQGAIAARKKRISLKSCRLFIKLFIFHSVLSSSFTFLQNPDNGFGSERPLDRDDVRRLVRSDLVVDQMLLKDGAFQLSIPDKGRLIF